MGEPTAEDIVEIRDLYSRFYWALNAADAEGMISCFAPGGGTNRYKGDVITPQEAAALATQMKADPIGATYQHHVTTVTVDPDAEGHEDRLLAKMYFFITEVSDPPHIGIRWSCSARDVLQRVDGKWRFLLRDINVNHAATGPERITDSIIED
jgi:hypothetical protein